MTHDEHFTFRVTRTDTGFKAVQFQSNDAHVGRGSSRAAAIITYCREYVEDSDE